PLPPVALMRAALGDNFYIVHFQQPGVADAALARDVRRVFSQLVRTGVPIAEAEARLAARGSMPNLVEMVEAPDPLGEPLLGAGDPQLYVAAFPHPGFRGALKWYRILDRNGEEPPELAGARIPVPSLMVIAEGDGALRPELAEPMKGLVDDLEIVTIPR